MVIKAIPCCQIDNSLVVLIDKSLRLNLSSTGKALSSASLRDTPFTPHSVPTHSPPSGPWKDPLPLRLPHDQVTMSSEPTRFYCMSPLPPQRAIGNDKFFNRAPFYPTVCHSLLSVGSVEGPPSVALAPGERSLVAHRLVARRVPHARAVPLVRRPLPFVPGH
jgi:hypothetical protein